MEKRQKKTTMEGRIVVISDIVQKSSILCKINDPTRKFLIYGVTFTLSS
jgi:hypothetical protein